MLHVRIQEWQSVRNSATYARRRPSNSPPAKQLVRNDTKLPVQSKRQYPADVAEW